MNYKNRAYQASRVEQEANNQDRDELTSLRRKAHDAINKCSDKTTLVETVRELKKKVKLG